MGKRREDFKAGMKVGHLRLLRFSKGPKTASPATRSRWRVRCEAVPTLTGKVCGKEFVIPQWYLSREQPKTHCGCLTPTIKSSNKKEYTAWNNMRCRCNETYHVSYAEYGGRGIRVYPEWDTLDGGFEKFLAYIGKAPSPSHSVDRIDNDGNYEPGNVRWATAKEQRANQRPRRYKS